MHHRSGSKIHDFFVCPGNSELSARDQADELSWSRSRIETYLEHPCLLRYTNVSFSWRSIKLAVRPKTDSYLSESGAEKPEMHGTLRANSLNVVITSYSSSRCGPVSENSLRAVPVRRLTDLSLPFIPW